MSFRHRPLLVGAVAGAIAAVVSVVGGVWLAVLNDDTPPPDGEFVLSEPGVYDQPLDELNRDNAGASLPDVDLVDAAGDAVTLAVDDGRPMVVNLWYSSCPPCRRELSDFAAVEADVGDRVRFVGINPRDTVEAMERFADERGVEFELLRDERFAWVSTLGVVNYPVTLFVDPSGRIVRQTGALDEQALRDALDELFGGLIALGESASR